jgi:hypothetical protein
MFSSYFFSASTRYWWLASFWHQLVIGGFLLLGIKYLLVTSFFLHQLFLYWLLSSWHQIFIGVFRV